MTFQHIAQKKKRLDEKRPLPVNTVKSLRENMLVEWTYNSNAIEGNTLTISETKVVLEGVTIGGKSMKESLDHAHTTGDYGNFIKLVAKCTEESLDLWLSVVG
jgi:Fic family protein